MRAITAGLLSAAAIAAAEPVDCVWIDSRGAAPDVSWDTTWAWVAYADFNQGNWIYWGGPERAVRFEPADFGLTYPLDVTGLRTQFYLHPQAPWPDSSYTLKVYAEDGMTLLWESETLEAPPGTPGPVANVDVNPPLSFTSGEFYVSIDPVSPSGHPSTFADGDPDGRSYRGSAGAWTLWTYGEFFVAARVGYFRGIISPSGGEHWAGGDTHDICWNMDAAGLDFLRLLLSIDGGIQFPDTIAAALPPDDTLYEWEVPSYNCAQCRVRVEAADSSGSAVVTAEGGDFTIDSEAPGVPLLAEPPDSSRVAQNPVHLYWHTSPDSLGPVRYHAQAAGDSLFSDTIELLNAPVGPDTWNFVDLVPYTDYWWHVRAGDEAGNWSDWSEAWTFYLLTGVAETPGAALAGIGPARPNPFRHTTEVKLVLPEPGGYVHAAVYNAAGRFITEISRYQRCYLSRTKTITWTPGPEVRPGVYYIRARVDGRDYIERVVLAK